MTTQNHTFSVVDSRRRLPEGLELLMSSKIAITIIRAGTDYLLALKDNQGNLHDYVRAFFNDPENLEYAREKGGGRNRRASRQRPRLD